MKTIGKYDDIVVKDFSDENGITRIVAEPVFVEADGRLHAFMACSVVDEARITDQCPIRLYDEAVKEGRPTHYLKPIWDGIVQSPCKGLKPGSRVRFNGREFTVGWFGGVDCRLIDD